ncbi:Flavodoxin reductases (ferredoxin-NADPH reductases) family 1, Vanillate O-demethylase oxidoreductase [Caballeronia sordidicola]|uniref:Flavodoxin reductases (Ferredoxin-NADPH reductases) family 1, Vanillate O-demethylase oxidoreductase n=2 Tax=Caballeronia sordidicola TaxID=196367 RepID=A0A226X087_CABSO|nr:Flavodoxin reductases (ferredoxin-NADPH reductases) family 1, Vanillate O-demethylase oxidoreductase [Caballeronia sordidicola]
MAVDVALFELVSTTGEALPPFAAGSHIEVLTPGGLIRHYSLCNDPEDSLRYQIAILKEEKGRGGSRAMHETVEVGSEISISEPKNHFPLAHSAQSSLLFAGGIGITPLLCMAERLSAIDHPFALHYCTRSAERTAFRERIAASLYAEHAHLHFDDGAPDQKANLEELLRAQGAGVHLYTCGPKGFMDAVLSTARRNGWTEDQLHYEFFSAEPVKLDSDGSFEIQLASSGRVIPVAPNQTAVSALRAEGVDVPTSCEQGVCGTCLTRVLDGEPDHRDLYLSADEQAANDQFLPCCSRAKSTRLVLDL